MNAQNEHRQEQQTFTQSTFVPALESKDTRWQNFVTIALLLLFIITTCMTGYSLHRIQTQLNDLSRLTIATTELLHTHLEKTDAP